MKKIDKDIQDMIASAIEKGVEKGMEKAMGIYTEVWLTADELVKQFGMISEDFIKRRGKLLPRERMEWLDEKGVVHQGAWAYPRNEIQRMIQAGELRCLQE